MKNADMPAMPVVNSDGFSAHPLSGAVDQGTCSGLSKREYFAAMAMQGLTSSPLELGKLSHAANKSPKVYAVEQAVAYADALLKELEKDMS